MATTTPTQAITDSVVKNNKTATAPPAVLPATQTAAPAPNVAQNNFQATSATGVAAAKTQPSTAYVTNNALI